MSRELSTVMLARGLLEFRDLATSPTQPPSSADSSCADAAEPFHPQPILIRHLSRSPPRLYHSKIPRTVSEARDANPDADNCILKIMIGRLGHVAAAAVILQEAGRSIETPAPAGRTPGSRLEVSAGGYHGKHFTGPVYIPRSSPMEDGTTAYNVTYQDGVTVLSKEDTMRHLVTIRSRWQLRL